MYALSLRVLYAFAFVFFAALLIYYLPYLLMGLAVVLGVLLVVAAIAFFMLRRKYGALFKSMKVMSQLQKQQQDNPFAAFGGGSPFGAAPPTGRKKYTVQEPNPDRAQGPVIDVQAIDVEDERN